MDAYQQQQQPPHHYMRPPPQPSHPPPPPPPSQTDPHLQQQQQQQHYYQYQPPHRGAAPPPPGSWYSSNQFQFQYQQQQQQHHNQPHPPSPQQPPSQWGPPPHPDHSAYRPPPHFPSHHHNGTNNFPPPPPPPRPYMPPSQIPNSYPHASQEWNNPNWPHPQAPNNVEDWGAKAREWANTRATTQDQPVQSQITPAGRPEEQNHFHDPYSQPVDPRYMDAQHSLPVSSYQQFSVPAASSHGQPANYPTDTSRPSSYIPDGYPPYQPNSGFLQQENLPAGSFVHLQEVPSSYSSVSGKEMSADEKEQSYKPLPISSAPEAAYHMQPPLPDFGRSVIREQSMLYGNRTADPAADLSDRPLDFAPRFNNDHDRQMQSNYNAHHESLGTARGMDPVAIASSINSWTPPVAPDAAYPPVLPHGAQHDPLSVPSPVSGHTAPSFPRFPGPSFQPHIPSATAPFGLGVGAQLHSTAAFPGDAYGAISERPKKGPVPNWLKEEILRNKATIAKSSLDPPKEETEFVEDEAVDKSLAKNDQADSKSIDSSKSTEDEDDDEDYVEAARSAAVNQEIKRVLTEVLLKVTDELFSEIATKVVNEDDSTVEVGHNTVASNHKVSPSSSLVPISKASARVLVPSRSKEPDTANVVEKSNPSSPGNLLGLASYASDEDEDDETQSSKKLSQDNNVTDNGNSQVVVDDNRGAEKNFGNVMKSKNKKDTSDESADRNYEKSFSSKVASGNEVNINSGKLQDGNNGSKMNDILGERVIKKFDSELPDEDAGKKSTKSESQGRETRVKPDKNDQHESRKSSFSKDPVSGRELEVIKSRGEQKGDDERLRKQKIEDRNGSKERDKEPKSGGKAKESDSRKRSSHRDKKDDKKDADRSNKDSAKEVGRKRDRTKEEDRSRHKRGNESSRHKRRRSSSISSRGRKSKDNSSDHANESSDETSDGSKRKLHSRKRRSSPSPIKSRRRQVSRSPHSKHSQRRHSPYSSSENTRGRRSRSRSPVRR